ncbi:unnamed protein product [Meganyctiphanes norvegica]|uniref:Rotatin N-terminal domain-containing protein n=1 Tax=Meganyctiphanes norvegica TaxID=48144 RepID=A0AAV2SB02_MEGNR
MNTQKKLGHPISEIRVRALNSLSQKVKCKLVTSQQLSCVNELLPNLLKILNQGPQALWKNCIYLLTYVCQDAISKKKFQSLGGLSILCSVQNIASVDLLPAVKDLLFAAQDLEGETHSDEKDYKVNDYLTTNNKNNFNNSETKPSIEEKYGPRYQTLSEDLQSNYESVEDSCLEETIDHAYNEDPQCQPITFTVFPWLLSGHIVWRLPWWERKK